MPELDIDAVRLTILAVRGRAAPDAKGGLDLFAWDLAGYADALLARLAEVEGERDEARAANFRLLGDQSKQGIRLGGAQRWIADLEAGHVKLGQDYVRVMTERDDLAVENARLRQQVAEQAELARKTLAAAVTADHIRTTAPTDTRR